VIDEQTPANEMIWSAKGSSNLQVNIDKRFLTVTPDKIDWIGSEIVYLDVCDPEGLCDAADLVYTVLERSEIAITHVVNEGFIIESGGKKILIDALLDRVGEYAIPPMVHTSMLSAGHPFDDVDLVLATHSHEDHFEPSTVGEFLLNNPQAYFISTKRAVSALRLNYERIEEIEDRVLSYYPPSGVPIYTAADGIDLEIINLPHAGYQNVGYLVDIGGIRLLHMGDFFTEDAEAAVALLDGYQLSEKAIDIAFVPWPLLLFGDYRPIVLEGIQPGIIIPMHYVASQNNDIVDRLQSFFPDSILFREGMQSVVIEYPH
jgi:L-ascorbate metabolism protein UlaG (beta-lactamase superfamily)